MIMPATSEVVSATSHWAVNVLDRMATRTMPTTTPIHARFVARASGWRRWMMLPRTGRRDPRKYSTSTMARSGMSSRMPFAGSHSGHQDWSATSTMPDWNMPMRNPPATARGMEVRLPTRAAASAGTTNSVNRSTCSDPNPMTTRPVMPARSAEKTQLMPARSWGE